MSDKSVNEQIIEFLRNEGIVYAGQIPFGSCKVIKPYLLKSTPETAIMMLVPYYTGEPAGNISVYSSSKDYHIFFSELFSKLNNTFGNIQCFADHSPIAEVDAAAKAKLGVIGKNNLLINDAYGSYVFIGEVFTDCPCDSKESVDIKYCMKCNICQEVCPSKERCLSAITQKKGELDSDEIQLIQQAKCIWGCDICQKFCPHNKNVKTTELDFFKKNRINSITSADIDNMSDEEFKSRAFSWRGRGVIERNLEIYEGKKAGK